MKDEKREYLFEVVQKAEARYQSTFGLSGFKGAVEHQNAKKEADAAWRRYDAYVANKNTTLSETVGEIGYYLFT